MSLGSTYLRLIRPWPFWNTNVLRWVIPQQGMNRMGGGMIAGTALLGMFSTFIVWTLEYTMYFYWVLLVTAVYAYLVPITLLVRYLKRRHMRHVIERVRRNEAPNPLLPRLWSLVRACGRRLLSAVRNYPDNITCLVSANR